MGRAITWQYVLTWTAGAAEPTFTVYRQSDQGHRFAWADVPAPGYEGMPSVDEVLQALYGGVLALMETTA